MTRWVLVVFACTLTAMAGSGCNTAPGRPRYGGQVISPDKILDAAFLYQQNCAGCHGKDGKDGAAIEIGNPLYLAIADDSTIRRVIANGVPGTPMPAFARTSGGMLTDEQIDSVVGGIRRRWAKPNVIGSDAPPYAATAPGDSKHGAHLYSVYCSSCHGAGGGGGLRAGSIVDSAYLALVSDQALRTMVIVGRPERGAPDWRADVPGDPMSKEDISDIVAWLSAQRTQSQGQRISIAQNAGGGRR